ncbi:MAG: hypothetical protein IGR92_04125 [Leptolyngbyaceae cyanobacterium T60_A2020_046]|nr:hypothetical protein [Leptolyngbyaceae cyanobacterium T60_A2020_046]
MCRLSFLCVVTIAHRETGEILAQGPKGWGFYPFDGGYYICRKYIKTDKFRLSLIPGFCIYKFFYLWLHLTLKTGAQEKFVAWMYVLPNPLFPFIWFRLALPRRHRALIVTHEERVVDDGKYKLNQNL